MGESKNQLSIGFYELRGTVCTTNIGSLDRDATIYVSKNVNYKSDEEVNIPFETCEYDRELRKKVVRKGILTLASSEVKTLLKKDTYSNAAYDKYFDNLCLIVIGLLVAVVSIPFVVIHGLFSMTLFVSVIVQLFIYYIVAGFATSLYDFKTIKGYIKDYILKSNYQVSLASRFKK